MSDFFKRFIDFQNELKAPKNQFNSFGKYKYRSAEDILEALKPLEAKYNILIYISDDVTVCGNRIYVKATATAIDANGESEPIKATAFAREPEEKKGMDASQITGTASSYARKYALNGLLCIDDTKDADTDQYQHQQNNAPIPPPSPAPVQTPPAPVCVKCGKPFTGAKVGNTIYTVQQVVEGATQKYGAALCKQCGSQNSPQISMNEL